MGILDKVPNFNIVNILSLGLVLKVIRWFKDPPDNNEAEEN